MTETNGEIKPMPVPFEENAYKYADKQAELYRGLKEPSGGYANIVDAYIAGATKETALLSQHILDLQKDKGNLTDKVRELEQQIEKMKCCENCKHHHFMGDELKCYLDYDTEFECLKTKQKWELAE